MRFFIVSLLLVLSLQTCLSFSPSTSVVSSRSSTNLEMNIFNNLFGPKKTASASHILVSGANAQTMLTDLKFKLDKSKNLKKDFSQLASKYSSCPSSKKGGALGTFNQGQMVPAFDRVVFNEELNTVHGPVSTPFGYHLILIDDRDD